MALATPQEMSSGKVEFTFPTGTRTPRYMSWCGNAWRPARTHGRLVDAKNSLRNRAYYRENGKWLWRESYILELVEGKWFVLYHIPEGTENENLPWMVEKADVTYTHNPEYRSYRETPGISQYLRNERKYKVPQPMSRDEYAEWRVAVDREIRGASKDGD